MPVKRPAAGPKRPETTTRPLAPKNGEPERPERVRLGVSHRPARKRGR